MLCITAQYTTVSFVVRPLSMDEIQISHPDRYIERGGEIGELSALPSPTSSTSSTELVFELGDACLLACDFDTKVLVKMEGLTAGAGRIDWFVVTDETYTYFSTKDDYFLTCSSRDIESRPNECYWSDSRYYKERFCLPQKAFPKQQEEHSCYRLVVGRSSIATASYSGEPLFEQDPSEIESRLCEGRRN